MVENNSIFVLGSFVAACCVKVQRLPAPGESLCADAFSVEAGGKGFNIAAGARRLGATVDGLLAVGDDLFASLAAAALTKMNLPHAMLLPQTGPTGAGVGFIDAEGENSIAVFPGANALLSASHVMAAGLRLSQACLVIAQFEIGNAPIKAAFDAARRSGCLTLLNPSPYRAIDPHILSTTDIIIVNCVEASRLAIDLDVDLDVNLSMAAPLANRDSAAHQALAERLLQAGVGTVIVTLGAKGAAAWQRGRAPVRQPAFRAEIVDTVGAGDAFTAGFAVALTENRPFEACLRWGSAAGACAATALGVLDALPDRTTLEALLSRLQ